MSPKRLVLFDIDGTLLHGGKLWKESFVSAVSRFFPSVVFPTISFNGKTDIQIAREMLAENGLSGPEVESVMLKIISQYIENARALLESRAHEVLVLPGVVPLLEELARHQAVFLGLLTGNVKEGAAVKLSSVGLETYFKFGVFGDDHWNRYELPQIAVQRVRDQFGHGFSGKEIVIIGDTIHDVNCGKSIGVRSIAVGTGRNVDSEELLSQNPDYYFKDLSATDEVLTAILEELD